MATPPPIPATTQNPQPVSTLGQSSSTQAVSSCPAAQSWKEKASSYYNSAQEKFKDLGDAFGNMFTGGSQVRDNISLTNIASNAGTIQGIRTAQPHQWTRGGAKQKKRKTHKTRRMRRKRMCRCPCCMRKRKQ